MSRRLCEIKELNFGGRLKRRCWRRRARRIEHGQVKVNAWALLVDVCLDARVTLQALLEQRNVM